MSFNLLKHPESPCMPSGCGDNSRRLLGIEQKKLFHNRIVKSQHPTSCRRDAHKATNVNIKKVGSCATIAITTCASDRKIKSCKRALSLEDLTPKREQPLSRRQIPTQMPTKAAKDETEEDCKSDVVQAARRVYEILLLNAWRRKRHDCQLLNVSVQQLGTQVDNLNIQTIVLKKLLDSEKDRVCHASEEVQQMVGHVEESHREKDATKAEKTILEKEVSLLEERLCEASTHQQNLKNDFLTARSEVTMLESQLAKERDKLAKLREDKKHLLEKVQAAEETVAAKASSIERLLTKVTDLKKKVHTQEIVASAAEAANQSLKQLEIDQAQMAKELRDMQLSSQQLKVRVQTLEEQLVEKDSQKCVLEKIIQDQQLEILNLRTQLEHHTQLQTSWSARALRIASMFASFPFTVFHNLAFIFMPYPPPNG